MEAAGLILIGGRNSRMDGKKKAYLTYREKYFYQLAAEAMGDIPVYLSVSGQEYREAKDSLDYPVVEDLYAGIGPIGGIASGLQALSAPALLVVPCDLPLLDKRLLKLLVDSWERTGLPSVAESEGFINPLVAVYTKDCLPVLKQQIRDGNYRASHCMRHLPHITVDVSQHGIAPECLQNINNWSDYRQLINR